jgi:hypothetical protein
MKAKESMSVGAMSHSRKEHAFEFLAAREQFNTRSCARCAGLLVNDWCYELIEVGEHNAEVLRCVQCGHCIDPVILRNQVRPPAERACAGHT